MREMHELGILHRDIKNANILLHLPLINELDKGTGQKMRPVKLIR